MALLDLTKEKKDELFKAFSIRFNGLQRLRDPLDEKVREYQEIYNFDFEDKKQGDKTVPSGYQYFIPYAFTIIQTILAFLVSSLFGQRKPVTIDVENKAFARNSKDIEMYVNSILEKTKFKTFAYDFLINSLVDPISWVQLIPVKKEGHFTVDIDTLNFFDVYFDTKAKRADDSDYIVRTVKGYLDLVFDKEHYYEDAVEQVKDTKPPEDVISLEDQKYETETKEMYYSPDVVNNNDEVEIMTWNTRYDIDDDGKLEDVIISVANRQILVRAELNTMKTERKTLIFPIVALRNSNQLMGRSMVSTIKDLQDLLNEAMDLRQRHFRLLVKLLFKYNNNANIDFSELSADGGNAIGFDGDPNDIGIFPINNLLRECSSIMAELIQLMQQVTGATDYMMGTSLGRGITETARGVSIITQNALQKFNLIVDNIAPYVIDIIKFIIILYNDQARDSERVKFYKVKEFVKLSEMDIEEDFKFDIALKNMAADIDRERAQFINAINIFGQLLAQSGGDVKGMMKLALEKFGLKSHEVNEVLGETPEAKKKIKEQAKLGGLLSRIFGGGKGGAKGGMANAQARQTESAPEEQSETGGGM